MNNEKQSSRYSLPKKTVSICLSAAMLATAFTGLGGVLVLPSADVSAAENTTETKGYGLAENIQDGTILHCFDWTYNDIKAELPNIAKAGFTAVQTSPAQTGGNSSEGDDTYNTWWWLYQPLGFYVTENVIGTRDELQELCEEADKYGIKIIVDVVANHLAGSKTEKNPYIDSYFKDNDAYWHTDKTTLTDRQKTINNSIGMPDLATENADVQQKVKSYIDDLKSLGVDGIRWDAAKHIGLPDEDDNFWDVVIDNDLYNYGEILGTPGSDDWETNKSLMKKYTNYMSLTDDHYGKTLRDYFNSSSSSSVSTPGYTNWGGNGISSDKLVYWGESHDTWSNNKDYGYSNEMTQNVIDRAYAIAASRNQITALYFSRPSETDKDKIKAGEKGSTHFTSSEVAAVNHFHNAMIDQKEWFVGTTTSLAVCREKGAVIVARSGGNFEISVKNGGGTTAPGTYKDEITGNTFTVTETTISGTVGSTGIAVIYDYESYLGGSVSASPATGTSFKTDTLDVTLRASKMQNAEYSTSEGKSGSYNDGEVITIGSLTEPGSDITVTVFGTTTDGSEVTQTYTYTKKDPNATVNVYFDNSSYNWSKVYAYIYFENSSKVNAAWPGVEMEKDDLSGYYKLELEGDFAEKGLIIFSDGNSRITGNRYPDEQGGGLAIGGYSHLFSADNSWEKYNLGVSLNTSSASVNVGDTVTLDANTVNSIGDVTYTFSNGSEDIQSSGSNTASWTPSQEGTYTVTVTAKDSTGRTAKASTTIKVLPKDISSAAITLSQDSFTYDGNAKTPTVTVTLDGKTLTQGTDYTVSGNSGTNKGTYTITVTGIGSYSGTVNKNWEIAAKTYTVQVENGKLSDGSTKGSVEEKTATTVIADEPSAGEKFSHWEVDGKTVSTSAKYSFIVLKDITVKAVYVDQAEVIEEKPILNLFTNQATYNNKNAVEFVFDRSIPSGYTFKSAGIIYGTNKLLGYTSDNTVNLTNDSGWGIDEVKKILTNNTTNKVKNYISTAKANNGTVIYKYAVGTNTNAYVYAVAYVIITDKNGTETTYYSNVIATTYNGMT